MTTFALSAFVGDIQRFASPKKLVAYVGLNPAFDDSGNEEWHGGIGGRGHKCLALSPGRGGAGHPALLPKSPGAVGQKTPGPQGFAQPGGLRHGPQTGRERLVFDDGPLDHRGGDRGGAQPEGRQNNQPGRKNRAQTTGQNQKDFPAGNLPITQNRQRVSAGPRPEVHPQNRPPNIRNQNMNDVEFNAWNRGLRSIPKRNNPGPKNRTGTDASAFHGRPGARVALLQSPILPAANSPYIKRKSFRGLPVDKPHTCGSWLRIRFQSFAFSLLDSGTTDGRAAAAPVSSKQDIIQTPGQSLQTKRSCRD